MSRRFIKDLQAGDRVEQVMLLYAISERQTQEGRPYLVLTLADRTGRISAVVWQEQIPPERPAPDDFVRVVGPVEEYKGRLQVRVERMDLVDESEVDESLFVRRSDADGKVLLNRMVTFLGKVEDTFLKGLADSFLSDRDFMADFVLAPAAREVHHPYVGGLLEHTHNVVRICRMVTLIYPALDADLLVVGAFLHDVGKVRQYRWRRAIDHTTPGRLVGHVVMGAEMMRKRALKIAGFPRDVLLKLEHMILSHHGRREWGSPVEPAFEEAAMLHMADYMDSRMAMFAEARRAAPDGAEWSEYVRALDLHVFLR